MTLPYSEEELAAVRLLIQRLGEDPDSENLCDTPRRFLAAWDEYWGSGYKRDPKEVLKTFVDGAEKVDEMVFQGNIATWSHCAHHLAPFFGVTHIAYIPKGRVIGLSKLARVVEIFARRLQIQERLCNQVADALMEVLAPMGVGVVMYCRHLCLESRGVQKYGTVTVTSALRGDIKNQAPARAEFMSLVASAQAAHILP